MNQYRTPSRADWRWSRATELTQFSDSTASSRLREEEDPLLTRVYRFKRFLDRNLAEEDPEMAVAHEIYTNDYPQRMMLEGLLLAGGTNEDVVAALGLHPKVSEVYHDAFFDVRRWIPFPMKICSMIFQGAAHQNTHAHDRLGIAHRVSWFLGKDYLVEYCLGGTMSPALAEQLRVTMERFLLQIGLETAMTTARHSENAHEFVKLALNPREKVKETGGSGKNGTSPELQEAMTEFMGQLTISVADPTDSTNLTQSPRELRESEYEVKSNG